MKRSLSLLAFSVLAGLIPTMAARAEETLIFATINAPQDPLSSRVFHPWADRVNEQAKGLVRVDVRDGYTLARFENVYDRTTTDVIQIGWALQSAIGGKFPLTEAAALPYTPGTCEQNSDALWRLYKSGALAAEYKDIVPLMFAVLPQFGVQLREAPASKLDLRGLKILSVSKIGSDSATNLGATPISLPLTTMYEGLKRGTIDGTMLAWTAFPPFKLDEVTAYHIDTRVGGAIGMVFMSRKKFDALPPEVQKVLMANAGEAQSKAFGKFWDDDNSQERTKLAAMSNHKIVVLTPEEEAEWRKKLAPVTDAWVAASPAARQAFDEYRKILTEVIAGN